jgi:hypothetical protein
VRMPMGAGYVRGRVADEAKRREEHDTP